MAVISFSNDEKADIIRRLQDWFRDELDQELGEFDAGFLLDFFSAEIGVHFYNRGLQDAQTVLDKRVDDILEAIGELEKLPESRR